MPIETDIYTPRSMGRAVELLPPRFDFLSRTFFNREEFYPTEQVDVDYRKGGRELAPFVHPGLASETVQGEGFETKSYTAPLVAPDTVTKAGDLAKRMFGENLYSGITPAQRGVRKLVRDMAKLDEMIARRIEWMCAMLIFTGEIPIIGKGLNARISFNHTNKETITTATKKWSHKDSKPVGDLKRWKRKVQLTGYANCDITVMSADVADVFIEHPQIKEMLDIRNYSVGSIAPKELPNGVEYLGTLKGLYMDIYTYNEHYLDNWSDPKNHVVRPLVPENTVALLSSTADYSINYGAITQIKKGTETFETIMGSRVPYSFVAEDPPRRKIRLQSRPLPIAHEIDSWFVAHVL